MARRARNAPLKLSPALVVSTIVSTFAQVPHAVARRVLERAGIDLIDDRAAPPVVGMLAVFDHALSLHVPLLAGKM